MNLDTGLTELSKQLNFPLISVWILMDWTWIMISGTLLYSSRPSHIVTCCKICLEPIKYVLKLRVFFEKSPVILSGHTSYPVYISWRVVYPMERLTDVTDTSIPSIPITEIIRKRSRARRFVRMMKRYKEVVCLLLTTVVVFLIKSGHRCLLNFRIYCKIENIVTGYNITLLHCLIVQAALFDPWLGLVFTFDAPV